MSFFDSMFNLTGGISPPEFRISIIGNLGVYIEGVLRVKDVKKDVITVQFKDGIFEFKGEGIFIRSYGEKDLYIRGKIDGVNRIK